MLGEFQHGNVKLENGFQYFFSLMRPKSEGRVWIDSADPMKNPKFLFNYFQHRDDVDLAVAATKAIRETVAQSAWDDFRGVEWRSHLEKMFEPISKSKRGFGA